MLKDIDLVRERTDHQTAVVLNKAKEIGVDFTPGEAKVVAGLSVLRRAQANLGEETLPKELARERISLMESPDYITAEVKLRKRADLES